MKPVTPNRYRIFQFIAGSLLAVLFSGCVFFGDSEEPQSGTYSQTPTAGQSSPLVEPVPLALQPDVQKAEWALSWWGPRHVEKLEAIKQGPVDLILVGNSITHGWENYQDIWDMHFGEWKTVNLGFSGDRTEHVLWRLQNGEVRGISPKVAVVMIGTNNTGHRMDPAAETAAGIKAIIRELRARLPNTRILLLAIFPRSATPDDPMRVRNEEINKIISGYANGENVVFLNINDAFLLEDGTLTQEMMPDLLHPKAKGYEIWAKAMGPTLREMME